MAGFRVPPLSATSPQTLVHAPPTAQPPSQSLRFWAWRNVLAPLPPCGVTGTSPAVAPFLFGIRGKKLGHVLDQRLISGGDGKCRKSVVVLRFVCVVCGAAIFSMEPISTRRPGTMSWMPEWASDVGRRAATFWRRWLSIFHILPHGGGCCSYIPYMGIPLWEPPPESLASGVSFRKKLYLGGCWLHLLL